MNTNSELDRIVEGFLEDRVAAPPRPDVLRDAVQHTSTTPQARRRFLGRWLDRDEGAGRRATEHDHPPDTNRRTRLMLSATGITAAIAILALAVNVIETEPVTPGADGTGESHVASDYDSIQAAVDAASDGDTIIIPPGIYSESVLVDKDLVIIGGGGGPTSVVVHIPDDGPTGDFDGRSLQYGFWFDDATVEIANLSIEGPGAGVSALVAVGGELYAHGIVEDLDPYGNWPYGFLYMGGDATGMIHGNTTKAFVWIDGEATPTLRENTIHNVIRSDGNSAPHFLANEVDGVWADGSAAPIIESNTIDWADNGGADGGFSTCGIEVASPEARPTIIGNTIRNASQGICVSYSQPVEIRGNTLDGNQTAITLGSTDTSVLDNEISGDGHGIAVNLGGSPTISGNTIDVGRDGITVMKGASPVVEGNTVCGGENSILVADGSEAVVGENDVC